MRHNLGNLWFVVQEFKMGRISNYTSRLKCVWGGRVGRADIHTISAMAEHHHGLKCAHCPLVYNVARCKFPNVVNVGIWA